MISTSVSTKRSPFFYVGDKFKLIGKIKRFFPRKIRKFVEPFLGGGSVFLNVEAEHYILNDIDKNVINLHRFLINQSNTKEIADFLSKVKKIVSKYNLSCSLFEDVVPPSMKKEWVKTYYARYNRVGYNKLKSDYNNSSTKDPLVLYLLLIYGFNRMLRFNKHGDFNIPVGNVDFNQNVAKALDDYFSSTKNKNIELFNQDFSEFINNIKLDKNDFVYVDPPYLLSASEYNKLWGIQKEELLLNALDLLNKKGVKFALSNILSNNGKKNEKLVMWMKNYNVHKIDSNYINYHNNSQKHIEEVLITNY